MDFARKQLEKYGWQEGKGLGKNENGICTAIKPKLKFDNAGIGHEAGKDFTNNWWENVYNKASNNIRIADDNGNIKMNLVKSESVEITTKDYSLKELKEKNNDRLAYGTFLKTSKLTQDGTIHYENIDVLPQTNELFQIPALTDDELFAACGGRTAHKGARHGLKLSGKLSRIEKQEKMLLKKLQNVSLADEDGTDADKKLKKLSKMKSADATKRKKSKRTRKSVSFNETVTEYHTLDLDTSSESADLLPPPAEPPIVLQSRIKDAGEKVDNADEGIEQDCGELRFDDRGQSSFQEMRESKKAKKRNRATDRFLEELTITARKLKRKLQDAEASSPKRCRDGCSKKALKKKKKKKKRKAEKAAINSLTVSLDQISIKTDADY